jgi:Xaa-Pro aminopeptidase
MTGILLDPVDVSPRLARLRDRLGPAGALLVTSLTNVRYLTGFTGSAGMLFLLPDATVLVTDGRYESQAAEQLAASGAGAVTISIAPATGQRDLGRTLIAEHAIASLALEAAHVSWARQRAFTADWFPGVDLEPTVGLVEGLRAVKDATEMQRLSEAARIADAALDAIRPRLAEGLTEAEFGRCLDFEMGELGASGPSFETIVAAGPNAAKPHHRPSGRPVGREEPVVLDFGALLDGYCSDMTRTVWVDRIADPDLRRAYDVVLASQAAGVAAVRAGTTAVEVDRACREVIADAGWGDRFVHGTGHGVGLDIHEAPSVSATSTDTLVAGHVVTVEPGVYLPGLGGVRIEDTVVVTDDGCRPLTGTPKDRI